MHQNISHPELFQMLKSHFRDLKANLENTQLRFDIKSDFENNKIIQINVERNDETRTQGISHFIDFNNLQI